MTASAFGFIAIFIVVIGAWDIFTEARSQTPAPQGQMSPAELSAAIEAQREASARLTRSATFDQRFRKLSERAQKKGTVSVIVRVRAAFRPEGQITSAAEVLAQRKVIEEAQDQLLSWLRYAPSSLKRYDDVPYVAVSTDSYGLAQLQSSADVLDVFEDKPLRPATAESLPQIKANRAWAGGYTGAGKTVVILDSGVDKAHSDLSNKVVAEACFSTNNSAIGYTSLCPHGDPTSTEVDSGKPCEQLSGVDNCGHGTHLAGIAAGRSGVAINANIISIQVMSYVTDNPDECGFGPCLRSRTSDVMAALQHVYDNLRSSNDIAAINISLVTDITGMYPSPCDEGDGAPLKAEIDQLKSVGIATVVAAGNDGFTNALNYPACISTAVSVGAVGDGSGAVPVDTVWQYSNGASYLNLLAPGVEITSAIPGGDHATGFGTSQAAAHVSGAWALLKQKEPAISVDDALNRFKTTGVPVNDTRNSIQFRRIQLESALGVTVPESRWLGAYYNNPDLDGNPVLTNKDDGDGFIDLYFNGASPAPGFVGAENYSIRWTRTVTLTTTGTYRFSVTGDDGVRLYIDGQVKIDEWRNQAATTYNADVPLQAGNHEIKLEYYQATGPAQARLNWGILNLACSQAPSADHWKGEYFNNANLAGSPVMTCDDGNSDSLNFNWGGGGPNSACNLSIFPDYFSVRWTRTVNFPQGIYRFTTFGDNGVRLWVDDQLWINRWTETVGTDTANVQLSLGNHKIVLEFFETWGGASVSLSWAAPPDPPSNLVASVVSPSQINLSWADNSGNEDGFKIERRDGSSYSQIGTVGANVTTYADSGLATSTTYYYRVRAYNSSGDSGYSNESGATTLHYSINISGEECRVCTEWITPQQCLSWTYDGGAVTATINGIANTINYGRASTAASIASSLASKIASQTPGVAATVSGTLITITPQNAQSFTITVSVNNGYGIWQWDFPEPSFNATVIIN
jgi:hypothetical protein